MKGKTSGEGGRRALKEERSGFGFWTLMGICDMNWFNGFETQNSNLVSEKSLKLVVQRWSLNTKFDEDIEGNYLARQKKRIKNGKLE